MSIRELGTGQDGYIVNIEIHTTRITVEVLTQGGFPSVNLGYRLVMYDNSCVSGKGVVQKIWVNRWMNRREMDVSHEGRPRGSNNFLYNTP